MPDRGEIYINHQKLKIFHPKGDLNEIGALIAENMLGSGYNLRPQGKTTGSSISRDLVKVKSGKHLQENGKMHESHANTENMHR